MAALSDIIKRISAGSQAAKQSLSSGGTQEQARQAAQQAAGGTARAINNVMQDAQRQYEQTQAPIKATLSNAPGMQEGENGEVKEIEESSITKDREDKKNEKDQINPWDNMIMNPDGSYTNPNALVPVAWYPSKSKEQSMPSVVNDDTYMADATNAAMPDADKIANLSDKERDQWQANTALGLSASMMAPIVAATGLTSIPAAIGLGGMTALGVPLTVETEQGIANTPAAQMKYDDSGNAVEKPESEDSGSNEVIKPTRGSNRSQMQEYYDWLANTDEGRAFADMYADYADANLGYSNLRASNNADAWGYLLGLQGNQGIDNWRNRYTFSGVDFSDEDAALDNLMNYLYGDNAVNIYDYMRTADNISLANDADAMGQAARYLASMYGYGPDPDWANDYGLDANDVASLALARQITNNGWGNLDPDQVSKILQDSGDKGAFKLVGEDSDEYKNSRWREEGARSYGNAYMDQLAPYANLGLADENITASLMKAYNDTHNQKLAWI